MPKFQQTRILLLLTLIGLLIADWQLTVPLFAYVIPFGMFVLICGIGAAGLRLNFYTKVVAHGKTDKKQIALTFDDGPTESITPQVLALLKKQQLPATFFLIGHKIAGNEAIVRQIESEGHLIGNHSFSHSVGFDFKWTQGVRQELMKTQDSIFKIIGKQTRFFRPPYGVTNPHIAKAARQGNYQVIGWNVRPYDAVLNDKTVILGRIKKGLKPGSIVLLHDIKPVILEVLTELIPFLQQEGYEVVALEELIGEKAYF